MFKLFLLLTLRYCDARPLVPLCIGLHIQHGIKQISVLDLVFESLVSTFITELEFSEDLVDA